MTVKTWAVIQMDEGCIEQIDTFTFDEAGEKEAEDFFSKCVGESLEDEPDKARQEAAVENGYFHDGDYTIFLMETN